ncbi:major facilitator superfamily domain-containing protein [Hypoxylon sp. FL1284]|nr:major facilitator superfamily domain-containing protein [Hypoxylon sp. FL1284]
MLFIVNMDASILTTSVVVITNDLGGFDMASWVLSSYMLGYVGVMVIFAKFSDIYGRKSLFLVSIALFTAFSIGCGVSQTIVQLIVLRAFQGVGGGGCFALCTIFIIELVPPHKIATFVAFAGIAIALAMVLGPIIGGAISSSTHWRWIFVLNIPIGVIGFFLSVFGFPNGFPYHATAQLQPASARPRSSLGRVDIPGTLIILAATVLVTAGFQEAGSRFPWKSAYVITLITLSGILFIALLLWERHVTLANGIREPILPWRFFTDHAMAGILLGFTLVGGPMAVMIFQLPQRFQLVHGFSPLDAGARIIPFGAAVPFGTIVAANILSKTRFPAVYILLAGTALQIIGFALLGVLPSTTQVPPGIYGYQVLSGVGCGANYQAMYLAIAFVADRRDSAVGMGAADQARTIGSVLGLSIVTSIFNGYIQPRLAEIGISSSDVVAGLAQQRELSDQLRQRINEILGEGYNKQMLAMVGFSAAQLLTVALMWRRKQITGKTET